MKNKVIIREVPYGFNIEISDGENRSIAAEIHEFSVCEEHGGARKLAEVMKDAMIKHFEFQDANKYNY